MNTSLRPSRALVNQNRRSSTKTVMWQTRGYEAFGATGGFALRFLTLACIWGGEPVGMSIISVEVSYSFSAITGRYI